ncbi:O-methyltransferase [Vibrio splendidus]|uniref:O-methyltransferase n=1 Tax=Vibrio splendidus TaxID=29497 RepID=UPI000E08CF9F|nr:O-methyltransferase [Vibrio splendidus]
MSNSGKLINYGVRPAKNIERKMMRDMFLRLFPFCPLPEYQYVGLGAKYFVDFFLFHKSLHIDKMISIEGDTNNRKRYHFNKPFDCIDIKFGHSNTVLPKINLDSKSIIWMDYDSRFNISMLDDLSIVISKLQSGSIFCLSYNSEVYTRDELKDSSGKLAADAYKQKFTEIVGEDNIPQSFDERGWTRQSNFSGFLYNSIIARLNRSLQERNDRLINDEEKLHVKQVMYFDYADGSRMETLGFVLYKVDELKLVDACNFEGLPFFKSGKESFTIKTPNLTQKEIRHLSEKMPNFDISLLDQNIFSVKDVTAFSELYKYFPAFNEIEVM